MKKYLTMLMISTFFLTSCGRNSQATVVDNPEEETYYSESYYEEETDYDESDYEDTYYEEESYYKDFSESDYADYVRWYDFEMTDQDSKGYSIRKAMHISQWISYDNDYDTLSAVWDKVSKGNSLPSKESMGCQYSNCFENVKYTTFIDYDEVFYAVGYLESYNETPGFDLSASNTLSEGFYIECKSSCASMMVFFSNEVRFYGVDSSHWFESAENNMILYSMKSNHWGPVPFVICYVVDKTPAHPLGSPTPANLGMGFVGDSFTLGSGVRPTSANSKASELIGDYTGTYQNSKGEEVGCDVSIFEREGILTGVFSFYNLPGMSNTEEGSYTMNVNIDDQGNYRLLGDEWLDRPEGYTMISCWNVTLEGDKLTGVSKNGENVRTISAVK